MALLALAAGCAAAPGAKHSFMGRAEGMAGPVEVPVGLNPLGSLDACGDAPAAAGIVVLVSRPEHFSMQASIMILRLREALTQAHPGPAGPQMLLSQSPIVSDAAAEAEGRRCGALVVLWERPGSQTLELTLPQPALIPVRHLVRSRLCEFGSHQQQLAILVNTIAGLVAVQENDYTQGVRHFETANRIDVQCLQLPFAGTP